MDFFLKTDNYLHKPPTRETFKTVGINSLLKIVTICEKIL